MQRGSVLFFRGGILYFGVLPPPTPTSPPHDLLRNFGEKDFGAACLVRSSVFLSKADPFRVHIRAINLDHDRHQLGDLNGIDHRKAD